MYNRIKPKWYLRMHKVPKQGALIYGSTTGGQRGGLLLRIPTLPFKALRAPIPSQSA